ncbi:hypothetical protein V2S66_31490 [Streptomyces sp. V4-01]|uniref:Uncharacterized protein n=1 Tax=Actinacidiphila polyblastidii TaxID=3110430 RepID=A0ABU7PL78_9ACTN|nr:hypothetical protein [Streptomyces sp. V4-01]
MICLKCRTAADARAPRDQHCGDAKCPCGHRTDRYRAPNGFAAIAAMYDQLARVGEAQNARVAAALRRVEPMPGDRVITFPHTTTEG